MSVLKYFKNTPRSLPPRATDSKCNFFSSNLQRGPWQKKEHVAPPTGDRGLSPVWGGDRVPSPLYKPWPPFAAIPFVI